MCLKNVVILYSQENLLSLVGHHLQVDPENINKGIKKLHIPYMSPF